MKKSITFLLIVALFILPICLMVFAGCGSDEPTTPSLPMSSSTGNGVQMRNISLSYGQLINEVEPIIVTFDKELSSAVIRVTGTGNVEVPGVTTVAGKYATWTPNPDIVNKILPGHYYITVVSATSKDGSSLSGIRWVGSFELSLPTPPDPVQVLIEATATELWYQGDIGSNWKYLCNGKLITCILSKTIKDKEQGKEYKVIDESEPFISVITQCGPVSPFLVFRKEEKNRIIGFGEAANESIGSSIEATLLQNLAKADFPLEDIRMEFESTREWVVLEKAKFAMENEWDQWIVATIKIRVSLKSNGKELANGSIEIQGRIVGITKAKIGAENITGANVQYLMTGEVDGKPMNPSVLCCITFAPNIGIVSITTPEFTGKLVDYNIVF